MKQKIISLILVLIIISLLSIVVLGSKSKVNKQNVAGINAAKPADEVKPQEQTTVDILYWGTTCPHCHDTIEWMENNNVDDVLTIVRKEVYENLQNSIELSEKAKNCGLDERYVGVPLLYTSDGKCLIGTPDITSYLSEKAGLSETKSATERSQE
jgi:glutaredoxin-related protein